MNARRSARLLCVAVVMGQLMAACTGNPPSVRTTNPTRPTGTSTRVRPTLPDGWTSVQGRLVFHTGGKEFDFPWTVPHPNGWYVQRFEGDCGDWVGAGVFMSNVRYLFHHPQESGGCGSAFVMAQLPPAAVVVQLDPMIGLAHGGEVADTTFPLSLARFHGGTPRGWPGLRYERFFFVAIANRYAYAVRAWAFPHATPSDRQRLSQIVSSIRITGEVVPTP